MKILYTAKARANGGRDGHVESTDGLLSLDLASPKELGGPGGKPNPEILFAAGYSSCFDNAIRHVAKMQKLSIPESTVEADVSIGPNATGGFQLAVELRVHLPGMDATAAQKLVDTAHQVCPYSNAVRNNIEVKLTLV